MLSWPVRRLERQRQPSIDTAAAQLRELREELGRAEGAREQLIRAQMAREQLRRAEKEREERNRAEAAQAEAARAARAVEAKAAEAAQDTTRSSPEGGACSPGAAS